jgi:hypothetical protein
MYDAYREREHTDYSRQYIAWNRIVQCRVESIRTD